MAIYLINHGCDTHVVEADNQLTAIGTWANYEKSFNPEFKLGNFSIEEIKTKYGIIKASS